MKNITLSAPDDLIKRARERAMKEKTTLNERFREWLRSYAGGKNVSGEFDTVMERLEYVNSGRKFTREEMNER